MPIGMDTIVLVIMGIFWRMEHAQLQLTSLNAQTIHGLMEKVAHVRLDISLFKANVRSVHQKPIGMELAAQILDWTVRMDSDGILINWYANPITKFALQINIGMDWIVDVSMDITGSMMNVLNAPRVHTLMEFNVWQINWFKNIVWDPINAIMVIIVCV